MDPIEDNQSFKKNSTLFLTLQKLQQQCQQ